MTVTITSGQRGMMCHCLGCLSYQVTSNAYQHCVARQNKNAHHLLFVYCHVTQILHSDCGSGGVNCHVTEILHSDWLISHLLQKVESIFKKFLIVL